jgi:hypothetical protein
MACVSSTIGESITAALLSGEGETGNPSGANDGTVEAPDAVNTDGTATSGAKFARKADHQAGTTGLPKGLKTNALGSRASKTR